MPGIADSGEGNPTSYLLEQITLEAKGSTNGSNTYFGYNANNQVSEIKRVNWGYVTYNNDPPVRQENTITYSFEYSNQLAVKVTQKDGYASWTLEYDYVGDQIAKKTIRYADGSVQDSTLYRYDTDGNLTEAVQYTDKANYKYEFTYGNNLITMTHYTFNFYPQKKDRIEFSGFDKKINFIRTINGLPEPFCNEELSFLFYLTSAAGNYTLTKSYGRIGINDVFGTFTTGNYSYEYNEEGLPIRMYSDSHTEIFKYRKYK